MSESVSHLPPHPSFEQLQKQAKDLLKRHRRGDHALLGEGATLADAQFAVAHEYAFASWADLKHYVEALPLFSMEEFDKLATDLAMAHMSGEIGAVREVNRTYGTAFVEDFHDPLTMQERLARWFASRSRTMDLAVADARQMIAHAYGFQNWEGLAEGFGQPSIDPRSGPFFISSRPPFYQVDWQDNRLISRGPQTQKGWEAIFAVMKEHHITALRAEGIPDAALEPLSRLGFLTHLAINSNRLTDQGFQHLAHMQQLVDLEIGSSAITDRGLEALRYLTQLKRFQACWTQAISDAGAANLAYCSGLETVNLLGTATGDGLIRALEGKSSLRRLKTGRCVSDAGIKLLHQIPVFKTWMGGEIQYGLMSAEAQPNHLLIDGPFTDSGLADLVGLNGLFGLSLFWHSPMFTAAGLAHLRRLPSLGLLGCEGAHCDDEAMRQIAAIPKLRMLMGQGAVATDDGWEALASSRSIEYIWGRECPNLTGRGFAKLAAMPALRGLGVSCKNVNDDSLALLPTFPMLREIMPMDVSDAGFRHVGRCDRLERLWCMYCRDTGDAATEQIGKLPRLKTYYAGMTQITDASLAILGRMRSLEEVELRACRRITEAGVAQLATLPELRQVTIGGSPNVSANVTALFGANVQVKYAG